MIITIFIITFLSFKVLKIFLINVIYIKKYNCKEKMGIGDWGLGIGDWGLGPIPNPQSPIPNPHMNYSNLKKLYNKFRE